MNLDIKIPPPPPRPVNYRRLSLDRKCKTKSDNVIMVGLSLQKTPYGLGFFSIQCFLSNFYRCDLVYRGQAYTCLEQGYQCSKAKICHDDQAFDAILRSDWPADMKRLGGDIVTNNQWEKLKLEIMEDLVFCKFKQNEILFNCLLNTRPHNLIECIFIFLTSMIRLILYKDYPNLFCLFLLW